MRRSQMKVFAGLATVGSMAIGLALAAAPAYAAPTGNEHITTPSPYTPPVDANSNPVPDDVIVNGTGWSPSTQVYAIVCDGKTPTTPGWSVGSDCDNGTQPSAVVADPSGNVSFNGTLVGNNYAIGVFRGQSPNDLFNCLAPGDNPSANLTASGNDPIDPTVPSYGQTGSSPCQIRLSYLSTGSHNASDQFLPLALPNQLVAAAPVVTAQPSSQSVTVGATPTFSATATGEPIPTVQWASAPSGSTTYTNIAGATSANYQIPPATLAESGTKFEAIFTNTPGAATTTPATLTVVSNSPVVTTQPTSQTVAAGTTATFTAAATGTPAPSVQWNVEPGGIGPFTPIGGATSASYTTPTLTLTDSGTKYEAVFTNLSGNATTNQATVTVTVPPTVTTQPTAATVAAGQTATFSAAASGDPSLTVQWKSAPVGSSTFSAISGATADSYTTPATTASANGTRFEAVFTDAGGSTTTTIVTLGVTSPPAVTTQPASQTVAVGHTATFVAAASGNPTPTVQWDSAPAGSSTFAAIAGATSATYTTPATVSADSGTRYEALFTAGLVTATSQPATLTVNTPPVVTTQPASQTAAAATSVTFSAAATGSTGVAWKSAPAGSSTFTPISGATSASYTLNPVTAANNGTRYEAVFSNTTGSLTTTTTTTPATLTVTTVPVTISPTTLPSGKVGTAYSQTLTAKGGQAPYTFTLAPGSTLPAGLHLSAGGAITGTPTAAGTTKFAVAVTDAVGDPGSVNLSITVAAAPAPAHSAPYWLVGSDGSVYGLGIPSYGSEGGSHLNAPIVGMARTPDAKGYWLVASDGGVFTFGDAKFYGSEGGSHLNQPIVGITATTDGKGYLMVASDGGVFTFGDAKFYGSEGGSHLNQPIVGITATTDGKGYLMVASDGGVFTFGDAKFYGSEGGSHLNQPIVGITATTDGKGYLMVASDGGVFTFGDAVFYGSKGGSHLNQPIVGIAATTDGKGYSMVASDGGVFTFGDATFYGSPGGSQLPAPIIGITVGGLPA